MNLIEYKMPIINDINNLPSVEGDEFHPNGSLFCEKFNNLIDELEIGNILKGDKGDTGEQGIQGIQGLKGDTGLQGLQGLKGDKGDTGLQGLQGLKGDKGDQGFKGDKGDTGIQGIQGTQGIQGLRGDKGDTGLQGDKGDSGGLGVAEIKEISLINVSDTTLFSLPLPTSFLIYQVSSSCNVRVRLYLSEAKRLEDLLRESNQQITGEHECFLDCLVVNSVRKLAPPPIAITENNLGYFSITNLSGIIQNTIDIQLKILTLEA